MDLSNEAALVIPLSLPRARPEPGSTAASEPAPADLVTAARRGDRSAFAELYRQHVRMVHGLLFARVPRGDVDDLVHEVFLTAMRRLDSLRDPAAFPGWLAAIARNHAIDHLRRNSAAPPELPENLVARLADGIDGYAMVKKSLQMRADDPTIEFAAAIMTRDGREAVSAEHPRAARAGAQADRLLARNIGQLER